MGNVGTVEAELEGLTLTRLEATLQLRVVGAPVRRAFVIGQVAPAPARRGEAPTRREIPPR